MTSTERAMCTEAEDRIRELEVENERLRGLLGRLRMWDVMVCGTGDEPYWRGEIDAALGHTGPAHFAAASDEELCNDCHEPIAWCVCVASRDSLAPTEEDR